MYPEIRACVSHAEVDSLFEEIRMGIEFTDRLTRPRYGIIHVLLLTAGVGLACFITMQRYMAGLALGASQYCS